MSLANTVERMFASADLDYCIVGGVATYLYMEAAEPDSGRPTPGRPPRKGPRIGIA